MKIYNSLLNKKEDFKTIEDEIVKMYVCGPTVYDYIHIGNARPVIFFDVVKNYLSYIGYKVKYVSNITDVDDKIIKKALKEEKTEKEIVDFYLKQFFNDVEKLGSVIPSITPKATDYIKSMISFIKDLIKKEMAYSIDGDVYFRVSKIDNYGALSNQNINELEAGSRIKIDNKKENPLDFTLWKKTEEGIRWDSPWGKGRPGWHTECVVMIDDIFDSKIDIHGGGSDLKFPHHENEMAQSCAKNGHNLANYWMHVGRLEFGNDKMSKSLGNTVLVKELLEKVPYQAFRLFMLASPYRQPMKYTQEILNQFIKEWIKIERTYLLAWQYICFNINNSEDIISLDIFTQYMDDDFNTPNVITYVFDLVKQINVAIRKKENVCAMFNGLNKILNILGIFIDKISITEKMKIDYKKWQKAKEIKDYKLADAIKDSLIKKGVIL